MFEISSYFFYKVIEVLVRVEDGLSRDVVKHLNHVNSLAISVVSCYLAGRSFSYNYYWHIFSGGVVIITETVVFLPAYYMLVKSCIFCLIGVPNSGLYYEHITN